MDGRGSKIDSEGLDRYKEDEELMILGSIRTDCSHQGKRPVRVCADGDGEIAQAVPVHTGEPDAEPDAGHH